FWSLGLKKSNLRIFSISLVAFLLITSSGLVFGSWYLKSLEKTVTEKFEGQKWRFPSKIYSDSYLLYVGMSLQVGDLWDQFRRLGYREMQSAPRTKGEYRYQRSSGLLDIYLHDFVYPTESFKGVPVRISLQGPVVARIENQATGQEMFSLELEPELVTGLYDRIWQERRVVKLSEVPPLLIKAILAIEDERFYHHHGIDPVSIVRATWVNLRSGGVVQGGSTLTQQLMKNFFLTDERKYSRKIKEAIMALIAERKYSKEELLDDQIITRKQYEAAIREKLPHRELIKVTNDAPFYVDYLRRELAENYSNDALTREGLRIFTSLDLRLQRIAERSLSEGLKKLEQSYSNLRRKGDDDSLEGAIIVIRPQTGEIKAMVGGRSYQKSQFNRVFQAKRQPGSVFKVPCRSFLPLLWALRK